MNCSFFSQFQHWLNEINIRKYLQVINFNFLGPTTVWFVIQSITSFLNIFVQSAGAVEYTDFTSAEG